MRSLTETEAQWLFTKADLDKTPSRRSDISLEDELQRRKTTIEYGTSLAIRCGYSNDSPHARGVIATLATLVHRFYMRRSLSDFKEKLVAPTMLFLAAKIEEEPLKLRHIVNSCLSKWHNGEGVWQVDPNNKDNFPPQSMPYQTWEKTILAMEELALEALCFDMTVDQPWFVLRQALYGFDAKIHSEATSLLEPVGQTYYSEAGFAQATWLLLNRIVLSPLPILHHARIIAFSAFAITFASVTKLPLIAGLSAAAYADLAFGLEISYNEDAGLEGVDVEDIRLCVDTILEYCLIGLIDPTMSAVKIHPATDTKAAFRHLFRPIPTTSAAEPVQAEAAN